MKKEARFWEATKNSDVQCLLCAHHCKIRDGKRGICSVRENNQGRLYTLIYGSCSSIAVDPIEKKPFYHFYPGTSALSLGTAGCNFSCDHCQNYSISMAKPEDIFLQDLMPEDAIAMAQEKGCQGIAWTYIEPTIWHEYSYDSAKLAKDAGLYTSYVTNGYITEEPLKELAAFLDAMNVDVKAFTDKFYTSICKARLDPVLQTCERAKEFGIHLELTYLVIPEYNDSREEVTSFCRWVVNAIGPETPVHFSCFHPDFKMKGVPRTPLERLLQIHTIAKDAGVLYPYLGNVLHGDYDNTYCPACGTLCIERHGFMTHIVNLDGRKCSRCGHNLALIL